MYGLQGCSIKWFEFDVKVIFFLLHAFLLFLDSDEIYVVTLPYRWTILLKLFLDDMESISTDCQQLKREYDTCFNAWFKDSFLKGKSEDTCAPLFKVYQTCVKVSKATYAIKIYEVTLSGKKVQLIHSKFCKGSQPETWLAPSCRYTQKRFSVLLMSHPSSVWQTGKMFNLSQ